MTFTKFTDYQSPLDVKHSDERRLLAKMYRDARRDERAGDQFRREGVGLVVLAVLSMLVLFTSCTEKRTIYSTNNVPIAQDSTVCEWHKHGPKHHHHGRFCCFLDKRCRPENVTKEEADRAREGNPEFNTGAGSGGGDR